MHWTIGIFILSFLAGLVAGSVFHAFRTAVRIAEDV